MKDTNNEEVEEHAPEDCDCSDGFIILVDHDGPGLNDEDNCYCGCHETL